LAFDLGVDLVLGAVAVEAQALGRQRLHVAQRALVALGDDLGLFHVRRAFAGGAAAVKVFQYGAFPVVRHRLRIAVLQAHTANGPACVLRRGGGHLWRLLAARGNRAVIAALVDFLLHHLQQLGRNRQRGLLGLLDQRGVVGEGVEGGDGEGGGNDCLHGFVSLGGGEARGLSASAAAGANRRFRCQEHAGLGGRRAACVVGPGSPACGYRRCGAAPGRWLN
jgi:hypothetical protein